MLSSISIRLCLVVSLSVLLRALVSISASAFVSAPTSHPHQHQHHCYMMNTRTEQPCKNGLTHAHSAPLLNVDLAPFRDNLFTREPCNGTVSAAGTVWYGTHISTTTDLLLYRYTYLYLFMYASQMNKHKAISKKNKYKAISKKLISSITNLINHCLYLLMSTTNYYDDGPSTI